MRWLKESIEFLEPTYIASPIDLHLFPQVVQWAHDVHQLLFAHVQVALGGFNIEVAKQVFDVSDVRALVQQVRGKAVAQAVYAHFIKVYTAKNPTTGFVDEPEYYWYSSARDYYTKKKGLLEVRLLNWWVARVATRAS